MTAKTTKKPDNRKQTNNSKSNYKKDHFVAEMEKQMFDALTKENGRLFDAQEPQMDLEKTAKFKKDLSFNFIKQALKQALDNVLKGDDEKSRERLLMKAKMWAEHFKHNMVYVGKHITNIRKLARLIDEANNHFVKGRLKDACNSANSAILHAENLKRLRHNLANRLWRDFYPIFASRTDMLILETRTWFIFRVNPGLIDHSCPEENLNKLSELLEKASKYASLSGNRFFAKDIESLIKGIVLRFAQAAEKITLSFDAKFTKLLEEKARSLLLEISDSELYGKVMEVFERRRIVQKSAPIGDNLLSGVSVNLLKQKVESASVKEEVKAAVA
jgi:hypothetical protein